MTMRLHHFSTIVLCTVVVLAAPTPPTPDDEIWVDVTPEDHRAKRHFDHGTDVGDLIAEMESRPPVGPVFYTLISALLSRGGFVATCLSRRL